MSYCMIQRWFFLNRFCAWKFTCLAPVRMRSQHSFCAEHRVWAKPNKCFWSRICKIRFKNCELVPAHTACCGLRTQKFLYRKMTVHFKLNLKTDGFGYKMIFEFWKHSERLHRGRKQCVCLYKRLFCTAKCLLGTPKPLNCIVSMPGCAMASLIWMTSIGKIVFSVWIDNRGRKPSLAPFAFPARCGKIKIERCSVSHETYFASYQHPAVFCERLGWCTGIHDHCGTAGVHLDFLERPCQRC